MKNNGLKPKSIKAGKANMFLSPLFRSMFSSVVNVPLEFYDTDGASGAARGAGVGAGHFTIDNAFINLKKLEEIQPDSLEREALLEVYQDWQSRLESFSK
jgi:xylulokinase